MYNTHFRLENKLNATESAYNAIRKKNYIDTGLFI